MRKFAIIGIVALIIATAGCITPNETPIEETGNETNDKNIQRSDESTGQGIGLQDADGDGIQNKDDPDFQRGVNRSNNTVNTGINETSDKIDGEQSV